MTQIRTLRLDPKSELARILEETTDGPVLLKANGATYRVDRLSEKHSEAFTSFDVSAVRQALRASAGTLRHVDRAKLLEDLRAQRGQNSAGRPAE